MLKIIDVMSFFYPSFFSLAESGSSFLVCVAKGSEEVAVFWWSNFRSDWVGE